MGVESTIDAPVAALLQGTVSFMTLHRSQEMLEQRSQLVTQIQNSQKVQVGVEM